MQRLLSNIKWGFILKKILVTGGTGFWGKNFQDELLDVENKYELHFVGRQYHGLDCSLEKIENCRALFQMIEPDIVIHGAAVCGGILANKNKPADFLRINTEMAINVYECAREFSSEYVYSLGSVCSYPKYCKAPFREDDIWNGPAEETNFPYGQAKRTLLMLGQTYREQYGIKGAHLIPVNMMGIYDHFDLTNSHVIPALIRKFLEAVESNSKEVRCWGTGEATREFIYASDCARAIRLAFEMELNTELPINIGTGKDISISELANLIASLIGFDGKIVFTGEVSDGQPKRLLDVSRAERLIGFRAKTSLEEGLRKTINWFKENR